MEKRSMPGAVSIDDVKPRPVRFVVPVGTILDLTEEIGTCDLIVNGVTCNRPGGRVFRISSGEVEVIGGAASDGDFAKPDGLCLCAACEFVLLGSAPGNPSN